MNQTKCPSGKVSHANKGSALQSASRQCKECAISLRVYFCPQCKGWHLTSNKAPKPIITDLF